MCFFTVTLSHTACVTQRVVVNGTLTVAAAVVVTGISVGYSFSTHDGLHRCPPQTVTLVRRFKSS
jgi:hypothetical protein